jgi:hypothetical protein
MSSFGGGGVAVWRRWIVRCRKWVKEGGDVGKQLQKQKERRVLYSSGFTLDGM